MGDLLKLTLCLQLTLFCLLSSTTEAIRCGRRCLRCSPWFRCHACRGGFHLTPLKTGHVICLRGARRQSVITSTSSTVTTNTVSVPAAVCDINCDPTVSCTSSGQCNGPCQLGYGHTACGTCQACDPNCDPNIGCNVHGAGLCDGNCTSGYGLTPSQNCLACDPHCDPLLGCDLHGGGYCDQRCTTGYGLTPSHTCTECDSHCDVTGCSQYGGQFCDVSCVAGYQLTESHTCQPVGACLTTTRPLNLSAEYGVLASINYPNNYDNDADCQWRIMSSAPNGVVVIDFNDLSTEDTYDLVVVYDGIDSSAPVIATLSGQSTTPPRALTSTQPFMFIQFTSDSSDNYRGFLATFRLQ